MKSTWTKTAIWTALLTGSVGLMQYSDAANWFSTRAHQDLVVRHELVLSGMPAQEISWLLQDARAYNQRLATGQEGHTHEEHPDYLAMLNPEGNNKMGRVAIPALGVAIPIHHGTSYETLERAAGHQYGTSLPVGGADTHSVIVAHSGWITARLFNDLDQLGYGEIFAVTVAGYMAWYRVDQRVVVLPGEYDEYLAIVPGADLVTLFTCTPTGVNTHRLMVRGYRIPAPDDGDLATYVDMLEAGFPWWALIVSGTFLLALGSGRIAFEPIGRRKRTFGLELADDRYITVDGYRLQTRASRRGR
jgi:sortase A